ncbi:G-type lectin S-receptor-like serine/threonine-protein kinase At4g27290 isoform X2 [Coffea arabica]|uniref:Receptor-like serine/threonine-protein kinase n=1 Tax=Coffea arabica TaxID=13443 RepID=A0A6P6XJZ8_COFAR|nr:G-type lectin S-receptor-like serine/threonine-protein kinase At4g27290 isoform X2 [Coffea arabica]
MRSMKKSVEGFSLLFLLGILCLTPKIASVTDTLALTQSIKDGETMISAGGSFELGFFSPSQSTNRYVGIWYYNDVSIQTVVWVANREVPLVNTSGVLEVIKPGLLVLRNGNNDIIWSSSNSSISVQNPVAQLLDTGNLVVKDATDDKPETFLWQSFHHPTDTFLPGMKLGRNFVTGLEVHVSAWKSYEDPAPGQYTYSCDPSGYPQNSVKKGSVLQYRTGPWNGQGFSGVRGLRKNPIFSYEVVLNSQEVYYSYKLLSSTITRFTLSQSGVGQRWTWDNVTQSWTLYLSAPTDNCDSYGLCGAYGVCDVGNSATCGCLDKFEPKYPERWAEGYWSSGCNRKIQLDCHKGDVFVKYSGFKLPDTHNSSYDRNISLEECRTVCLENCFCTAYSSLDISNGGSGSGCLLWFGDLIDLRVINDAGQDIYIRMASSEFVSLNGSNGKKRVFVISLSLSLGVVLLAFSFILFLQIRKKRYPKLGKRGHILDRDHTNHEKDFELPLFELSTIIKATNNFSDGNELGQGGFGLVYKGLLEEGQEVAIKRLSKTSAQGPDEFKTEVICIAKLQHRNLVRLLGCCIEEAEKILIYEYMANKSLDLFIFDRENSKVLDWPKRFSIIQGIGRGILYLHQDSRLRIIHRDIKASNILLDADMNPKISDFGTARSFGGNETEANTCRIVGTHGYMSPEYAGDGLFSVKSDVYSFGVLVLETISGKRNRPFLHQGCHLNLLGHAWKLYKEGRELELVNSHIVNSCHPLEVLRSIHVGLLCVQQCPDDRPDMSTVIFMLGNEVVLPEAKQPGFFLESNIVVNAEMSITLLEAR